MRTFVFPRPLRRLFAGFALLTAAIAQDEPPASSLEEAYEATHQSYLRTLYLTRKPAQEAYLKKLKDWKTRVASKNHPKLLKQIEEEISALEKKMTEEAKALDGPLKRVPDLPVEIATSRPDAAGPKALIADFSRAELEGGVALDSKNKGLVGWNSSQARARWPMPTEKGVTYEIEISYASNSKGRLKVAVNSSKYSPNLADTGGFDKPKKLIAGEYKADSDNARITITPALHRSKEFVRLLGFRLNPIAGK